MSDITKKLKISQGLCCRYFPSKESVYDEALDVYAERIVQQVLSRWERGQDDLFALFHG